jgi:hypothetical protein
MSDLEVAVQPILRPMLKGIARPLSRADQKTLATWAVKTSMMLEFLDTQVKRPVPGEHYRWLRERQEPPPGTRVFAAGYDGQKYAAYYWMQTLRIPVDPEAEPPALPNAYYSTLCIGNAVLQVLGISLPGFGVSNAAPNVFLPIWPYERPLIWPGALVLDDAALEQVSKTPVRTAYPR